MAFYSESVIRADHAPKQGLVVGGVDVAVDRARERRQRVRRFDFFGLASECSFFILAK